MNKLRLQLAGVSILLWLGLGSSSCSLSKADEADAIPADFALFAQYGPGMMGMRGALPWTLTIGSDGRALQRASVFKENAKQVLEKSFQLTRTDMQKLITTIRESAFYSLSPRYVGEMTDLEGMIVRMTMDKKSHEVLVYALPAVPQKKELRRFWSVWNELLRVVPSPNAGQVPREWLGEP